MIIHHLLHNEEERSKGKNVGNLLGLNLWDALHGQTLYEGQNHHVLL